MVLWGKDKDQVQEQRTDKPSNISKENCEAQGTLHQGTSSCGHVDHSNGLNKV
jgi:hypothetical protein